MIEPEQIRLLIGDTRETEKEEIRAGLADGTIKLVIGTHALIEDPINFQNLQMVVIDEQHRFGVAQRAALRSKGSNPHLLVMTATPIPRSLALTVYGDLDLIVMDEMPTGRLPIETHVLHPLERERAYHLISSQVELGHQAFIIYPMVEQGDKEEELAAVEAHAKLQQAIFPNLKLGLLHGRMRPDDKEATMRRFRDGEFHILVSTSVVEVGVDIPNATIMLIEGANRFGLAQLHQFRGRVGRGDAQSYCLLIPDKEDALENQRLSVMAETNDGFVLAERDLEQRGPGEFLGTRQAGYSELRMASLTDVKLIEKARQQAQNIFMADPELARCGTCRSGRKIGTFLGWWERRCELMVRAIFPGTFDPIHYGHMDIARRAARLFDELIIAVYDRPLKNLLFMPGERLSLVRTAFENEEKIRVIGYRGLTVEVCRANQAQVIVRGLRVFSDFEYEFRMALANHRLAPDIDMIALITNEEHTFLSSSTVREIASLRWRYQQHGSAACSPGAQPAVLRAWRRPQYCAPGLFEGLNLFYRYCSGLWQNNS